MYTKKAEETIASFSGHHLWSVISPWVNCNVTFVFVLGVVVDVIYHFRLIIDVFLSKVIIFDISSYLLQQLQDHNPLLGGMMKSKFWVV